MNIRIERLGGGEKTLDAFAEEHRLTMVVRERSREYNLPRYYAAFDRVEIVKPGILWGATGDGETPEEAIANYANRIAGHRLVWHAYGTDRREFQAPNAFTA